MTHGLQFVRAWFYNRLHIVIASFTEIFSWLNSLALSIVFFFLNTIKSCSLNFMMPCPSFTLITGKAVEEGTGFHASLENVHNPFLCWIGKYALNSIHSEPAYSLNVNFSDLKLERCGVDCLDRSAEYNWQSTYCILSGHSVFGNCVSSRICFDF